MNERHASTAVRASLLVAVGLVVWLTSACQTVPTTRPARLQDPSPQTLALVKLALQSTLRRAQVQLGPEDLKSATSLSVLPPPADPMLGRNLDMPLIYDIILLRDGFCALSQRETGEIIALRQVKCVAL